MKKGKIPGACIVIIREGKPDIIQGFGTADKKKKSPVTPHTLFELASCSKSYTGLAVLQLVDSGLINLDDAVSKYLPWFYVKYYGENCDITLKQLLHHTSGIPLETIANIPRSDERDALEKTVRKISGMEIYDRPGRRMIYASMNYNILGLIIETVTGKSFEDFLEEDIFEPLGLFSTSVGTKQDNPLLAAGYKTGLFFAGRYQPPPFRGNSPAAYVVSDGDDVARWLKIQLGLLETPLDDLVKKSHKPGKEPLFSSFSRFSYAAGWMVIKADTNSISHTGLNPNFTCYMGFHLQEKIGVAVLANSNSYNILTLADYLRSLVSKERQRSIFLVPFFLGKYSAPIAFFLGLYLAMILNFIGLKTVTILTQAKQYLPLTDEKSVLLFMVTALFLAVTLGFLFFPATRKVNWRTLFVWSSKSFFTAVLLFLLSLASSYLLFLLNLLFP